MSEVTLVATTGRPIGSAPSRRLRAEGKVPAVLYGHGMDSLSVSVDRRELRHALTGPAGVNALINLSVDGVIHPTIVKSLQRDPIKRNVGHVDFIVVRLDEVIEISVAFHLEGEAKAVSADGGLVDPAVDTITVRTTPQNVPGAFVYDISDLQVGDVVRAGELDDARGRRAGRRSGDGDRDRARRAGREGRGAGRGRGGGGGRGRRGGGRCRGRTVRGRRLGRVTERRGTPADLLVMGLGNPGQEYSRSRHNVGAEVVEELARRHGGRLKKVRQQRALTAEVSCGRARIALAVPTTYVNLSGDAASSLIRRYGIDDLEHLVVVHDELDLEPGVVRIKQGGGLAGHNGLRSITQHLKTQDYLRVRIGVGKPPSKERGADHVLRRIPKRERELLDVAVQVAADAVEAIATNGLAAAMNDINGR